MRVWGPIYRKQCKRYNTPYEAHFLTFSCLRRQKFLSAARTCRWFLDALGQARKKHGFDLWAFAIMPDHAHVILLPPPNHDISKILTSVKLPLVRRAIPWVKKHHPVFMKKMLDVQPNGESHHRFWERGGGHDRNLRSSEEIHEKIRYVHENPVRAGLADKAEDWPWSSCRAWLTGVDEPIAIDRDSLPPLIVT